MKKKLLTILLSIAVILTSTVTVFATTELGDNPTTTDILATVIGGFPTSSELGWVNENGKKAFISGNILTVSFNVPLETILQKEENNYKYINDSGQNCTFVMTSGKLTSIIVSGALVPGYNGEFFPPAPVAQKGDTGYLTLQDAINAVQNNETIILLGDITTDSTFTNMNGRTFTIDLNNYKITTSAETGFDIDSANLTVKNGTVINNNTSGLSGSTMETRTKAFFLEKEGQGSLTLDGVKIESTGYSVNVNNNNNSNGAKNKTVVIKDSDLSSAKWCAVYANSVDESNELTISNSNIHSSWTGTSMAALQICMKTTIEKTTITNDYGAAVGCFENTDLLVKGTENSFVGASGSISTNGSKDLVQITIEGGKFKTTGTSKEAGIAFYHPDGSPLTIKGGTFEGATALYVKGGTIDIQGGSFTGTGNYEAAQKVSSGAYATGDAIVIEASGYLAGENYNPDPNPSVSISGGLFKSTNGSPIAYYTFDDNSEAHGGKMVSGGVLNKEIDGSIIVEGKSQVANTDKNTSAEYPYMIGNNTATIEVETGSKGNVVPTYQDETKSDVATKLSRTTIDLGPEALTIAADGNIVNESLEVKAKQVTGFETGDDLTITIKTYLDMSVEKVNITNTVGSEDNTFSVDITPKYVVVAKVNNEEEKTVSEGKDLSVTRTVPLKIYLPLGFANYTDRVWIKHHLKDGSSVVYGGEEGLQIKLEVADMVVEFDNPDGFSVFDVYLKKVSPDPKPSPSPSPNPGYVVPNTGIDDTYSNNHSLLKISSLSLLAIGTYLVIKKKKDND